MLMAMVARLRSPTLGDDPVTVPPRGQSQARAAPSRAGAPRGSTPIGGPLRVTGLVAGTYRLQSPNQNTVPAWQPRPRQRLEGPGEGHRAQGGTAVRHRRRAAAARWRGDRPHHRRRRQSAGDSFTPRASGPLASGARGIGIQSDNDGRWRLVSSLAITS